MARDLSACRVALACVGSSHLSSCRPNSATRTEGPFRFAIAASSHRFAALSMFLFRQPGRLGTGSVPKGKNRGEN